MLGVLEIMDAIRKRLKEAFPETAQYIDACPDGFRRPAFLVEYVTTDITDANMSLVHVTQFFTITAFIKTDARHNTDTRRLLQTQDRILNLFRAGLPVEDRVLHIKASSGGREIGTSYVDVQLEYFDERSGEAETLPVMGRVYTDMRMKEKRDADGTSQY